MANENNNVNKDVSNSLSKYSDYAHNGNNLVLDSANEINKWYAEHLNKITEGDVNTNRLETLIDNSTDEVENTDNLPQTKIETKIDNYDELQTTNSNHNIKQVINNKSRLKTHIQDNIATDEDIENVEEIESLDNIDELKNTTTNNSNKGSKISKRIATTIKGAKFINNTTNKVIKTGKTINTGLNEGGLKSFENTSSKIMTKPVKKVANKVTGKATNLVAKGTKKVVKKVGTKVVQKTTHLMIKLMQLIIKLIASVMKLILSMLPEIAPVIIILVVIVAFCSFFRIRNE